MKENNKFIQAEWKNVPKIPVAWGEVFDKLTILEIKNEKITDEEKLDNIRKEREEILNAIGDLHNLPSEVLNLINKLKKINLSLWDIENEKRACESQKKFDHNFIELARQVYLKNDKRAELKKQINWILGSHIQEEKSYKKY